MEKKGTDRSMHAGPHCVPWNANAMRPEHSSPMLVRVYLARITGR